MMTLVFAIVQNELLIHFVQEWPLLWDKPLDIFKDRKATINAWHEVCLQLRNEFELEDSKKNDFGKYK